MRPIIMQFVPKIVAESEPVFQDASNHNANSCRKAAKYEFVSIFQDASNSNANKCKKNCFLTCVLYIIFNESKGFCCAPTFNSCSFSNTTISLQKLRGTHGPDRECFSFQRVFGWSPFCLDCRDNQKNLF